MSSPVPPGGVLSAAASFAGPTLLRSASAVAAKPVKAFQVFRIDGFSWTKTMLPGGERVSSQPFFAGGRRWQVDLYPNGADAYKDTADAVALYLRMVSSSTGRVRVQYKFSLLDLATGDAAYELPAETGTLLPCPGGTYHYAAATAAGPEEARLGYAEFVAWEELERRRESLLVEDCLAVRCDVGVMELEVLGLDIEQPQYNNYYPYRGAGAGQIPPPPTVPGPRYYDRRPRSPIRSPYMPPRLPYSGEDHNYGAGDGDTSDRDEGSHRQQQLPDDKEYVRRCLAAKRQRTDRDE
ncbi:hypothetical protein EJB05_50716, partial [Eragrostis curvula]